MTVKELIEQLKSVPEDTMIVLDERHGIYKDKVFMINNQKYSVDENNHNTTNAVLVFLVRKMKLYRTK